MLESLAKFQRPRCQFATAKCQQLAQKCRQIDDFWTLWQPPAADTVHLQPEHRGTARCLDLGAEQLQARTIDATGGHHRVHPLQGRAHQAGDLHADLRHHIAQARFGLRRGAGCGQGRGGGGLEVRGVHRTAVCSGNEIFQLSFGASTPGSGGMAGVRQ